MKFYGYVFVPFARGCLLHYHYSIESGVEMDESALIEKAKSYLPEDKIAVIEAAYQFAAKAHEGQLRISGEPYVNHPLETAMTVADLQLDASAVAAALLHDVTEDCDVPIEQIEKKFGPEISKLVAGVTKLSKLAIKRDLETVHRSQAENLRKMLIAMAEDLRVVFIKLADRLHNMRTLSPLPPEKRRSIARETLEIYAPLAHRLGMWQVKWQLEDLSFRYLEPQSYHYIAKLVQTRREQRENFSADVTAILQQELDKAGIKAHVFGRPKHIYSIYNKMKKYEEMGKNFGDIHDLFAERVLVDTISDCYKALGAIHSLWHPLPEEFNDYIANPKANGYQSLHTTVIYQGTTPLEIQIRTYEMHSMADYGVAAHWRYKEGTAPDIQFEEKLAWLRQLSEWQSELDSEEFLESLKTDIFIDQVFVFTPNGEIKALPKGSTPLDFAYLIHTELGHRCIGAKVNGKLVPLNRPLKNGEVVEIMTTKVDRGPSLDWLNADLGFVKSSHSKEKIRQWFKKQERTQNIDRGRQVLEREAKRLAVTLPNSEELAKLFHADSYEDLLASIGCGNITSHQLGMVLTEEPEELPPAPDKTVPALKVATSDVQVMGVGDLLTHLAQCCHPLPGDDIIGYITRSQGITIHRKNCPNIVSLKERERLIEVNWGKPQEVYDIGVLIRVWNKMGVLRDITNVIADHKVNISRLATEVDGEESTIYITLEIKNIPQLTHLLSRIRGVSGVITAVRSSPVKAGIDS